DRDLIDEFLEFASAIWRGHDPVVLVKTPCSDFRHTATDTSFEKPLARVSKSHPCSVGEQLAEEVDLCRRAQRGALHGAVTSPETAGRGVVGSERTQSRSRTRRMRSGNRATRCTAPPPPPARFGGALRDSGGTRKTSEASKARRPSCSRLCSMTRM